MAGIFSGFSNMLSSLFNPQEGYKQYGNTMRDFYNQSRLAQQPFIQAGQNQASILGDAQNQLMHPNEFLSNLLKDYEMSPYAQQSLANAQSAGLNSLSAQGLLGSSTGIRAAQNNAQGIMNQDRSEYLRNLLNQYNAGLNLGQNIFNTGASGASNFANTAANFGNAIGAAQFGEANAPGDMLANIIRYLSNLGVGLYNPGSGVGLGKSPTSIAA